MPFLAIYPARFSERRRHQPRRPPLASRNVCRVRLGPDVPRESLAGRVIEVTKKSPGWNEPGLQGGQLHAPPILSKAQIHIKGCPKNAGRCPKKDPVSGRSRASRGQPPGGRGTLGCLP